MRKFALGANSQVAVVVVKIALQPPNDTGWLYVCDCAWNKDPIGGVIAMQTGPG